MNKKTVHYTSGVGRLTVRLIGPYLILSGLLLGGLFVVVGWPFIPNVVAQSSTPETMNNYCNRITSVSADSQRDFIACLEGAKYGKNECLAKEGKLQNICNDAAAAVASGKVKKDPAPTTSDSNNSGSTSSGTTSPSGGNNSGSTSSVTTSTPSPSSSPKKTSDVTTDDLLKQLNKQIEKNTKELTKLTDQLNKLSGENAGKDCTNKDDTQLDYYVAGDCSTGDTQIKDLFPEHPPNAPAILFFNGGGWHGNDGMGESVAEREQEFGMTPPDLKAAGFAMYDVGYRKGSSGVYYMLEDVLLGTKHMTENAKRYGIDPSKIIIWGDSAGGSLVMRAAATGKSGARVAVGWAAATNAWTVMFKSLSTFGISLDHSTCVPTDLAGLTNIFDLATGGSGDVAEYGQGLNSTGFSALGISDGQNPGKLDAGALLGQLTTAGKNLASIIKNGETLTQQIQQKDKKAMLNSVINIGTKKITECIDNLNAMSPALNADPDTPPSILVDFENDGLTGVDQAYGMRDKLRQLGVGSEAVILPDDGQCENARNGGGASGAGGCHLGYYPTAVCPSVKFIMSVIDEDREVDCEKGTIDSKIAGTPGGGSGSGSDSGSSANGSAPNNSASPGGNSPEADCVSKGGKYKKNSGPHAGYTCLTGVDKQISDCVEKTGSGLAWVSLPKGGGYCSNSANNTNNVVGGVPDLPLVDLTGVNCPGRRVYVEGNKGYCG